MTEGSDGMVVPIGFTLKRSEFDRLRSLIYDLTGIYLKDAKQQMVQSRLTRRLRTLQLANFSEYLEYLEAHPHELTAMVNRITTNKTSFFREAKHFRFLQDVVLPELLEQHGSGKVGGIRSWCAASSTGEEPYTIAMILAEFTRKNPLWSVRLLASDLDTAVLDTAQLGVYGKEKLADIPRHLITNWTIKEPYGATDMFGFNEQIHGMIDFRQINLIDERYPIRTQLDFIFCRNVFIYFTREDRDRVVKRFIDILKPGGYLFLGHSEVLDTEEFDHALKFVGSTTYKKVAS